MQVNIAKFYELSETLPYFREGQTPKTYPILGKSDTPGYLKRSGLPGHNLF